MTSPTGASSRRRIAVAIERLATALGPVAALQRARDSQGEPFAVQLQPAGLIMAVSEPDLVERLLTGGGGLFRGGHANAATVPLLGRRSVFLAEGEAHEHRRRLIGDVLTGATTAAANRAAALLEADIGEWPVSRPFPLMLRLRSLLLRAQLPLLVQVHDEDRRMELVHSLMRMLSPLATLGVLAPRPVKHSRWPPARLFAGRRQSVRALVAEEIRERRRRREPGDGDVLAALLRGAEDGAPLDDHAVAEEVVTLLLAATEVPAVALGWAIERLVRSPPTVDRLAAREHGLLEAVVAETLRVRPPVIGAFRTLAAPMALGRRLLPAGTNVMAAIPLVHRRTEMFTAPDRFCPDRFLERPVPGSPFYLPFGMGSRRCLGNELAPSVMAEVLDRIVRLVRLEPGRPDDERQRLLATIIVPGGGCLVRVADHRTGSI